MNVDKEGEQESLDGEVASDLGLGGGFPWVR